MTKMTKLIAPVLLALGLSACGGGAADYAAYCSLRAGPACSAEDTEAECVAAGEANTTCKSETDDYVSCVVSTASASDFTCDADGGVVVSESLCASETASLLVCALANFGAE